MRWRKRRWRSWARWREAKGFLSGQTWRRPDMFTQALERVLSVAAREALARRHSELTLEHLLFAAIHDPLGEEILRGAGADVERLRKDLEAFLDQGLEKLPSG